MHRDNLTSLKKGNFPSDHLYTAQVNSAKAEGTDKKGNELSSRARVK